MKLVGSKLEFFHVIPKLHALINKSGKIVSLGKARQSFCFTLTTQSVKIKILNLVLLQDMTSVSK